MRYRTRAAGISESDHGQACEYIAEILNEVTVHSAESTGTPSHASRKCIV